MRVALLTAALAAFVTPALAQQTPVRAPAPQKPSAPAQAQPPAPAPPPLFPCRAATEICYLAVVTGPGQAAILFTNAPQAQTVDEKPVAVASGEAPGTPLDLALHLGRVVMLTGAYDPKAGLTKAELVEVASPLVSLMIKAQLGADAPEPEPAPPPRGAKPQAPPRR